MNLDGSNIITISNDFNKPEGVFLNTTTNKLYVADTGNNVLKIVDVSSFLGNSEVSQATSEFKIYPNPTTDFVFVEGMKGKIQKIEIFDYSGRNISSSVKFNDDKIDVTSLNRGIYILQIITESGKYNHKLIKK